MGSSRLRIDILEFVRHYVGIHGFRGSRVHSGLPTAFQMRIYDKSVSFVRPDPKFRAKLVIILGNEHF